MARPLILRLSVVKRGVESRGSLLLARRIPAVCRSSVRPYSIAMATNRDSVRIVEVGPRDGLQNIKTTIPTSTKVELIRRLRNAGLVKIEATSVVSPRAVPQLADCRDVLADESVKTLLSDPEVGLPVLIPNLKGLEIAASLGVKEVAVFVAATEGFSRANLNCSFQEGLERARQVAQQAAHSGMLVRGSAVLETVSQLLDMGCYEVSLGDTVGTGVASETKALIGYLVNNGVPIQKLAGHFHDTYGQAVSNVWAAYESGVRVFDSSVAGLGGCPYAPGAKGNVATEDLVYLFQRSDIDCGVKIDELVSTGEWISKQLSRTNESRAGSAIGAKSRSTLKPSESTPFSSLRDFDTIEDRARVALQRLERMVASRITAAKPRGLDAFLAAYLAQMRGPVSQLLHRLTEMQWPMQGRRTLSTTRRS